MTERAHSSHDAEWQAINQPSIIWWKPGRKRTIALADNFGAVVSTGLRVHLSDKGLHH